jgi:hypothetical protein
MLSSGTVIDIFMSITDDDIRDACKKYPEEKYNFVLFSSSLIDAKERIRKAFDVYDSIQGSSDRDLLGRLIDTAVQQFRGVFDSIRNYSIDSEKYSVKTQVHDQIANRIGNYLESAITRGQLDKTNPNSPANNILDAYLLALQLEPKPEATNKPIITKKDIDDVLEAKSKAEGILEEAKRLLGPESIADYADFFAKSAQENSRRNSDQLQNPEKSKLWYFGFLKGGAQRFLMAAILLIITGVIFAICTHSEDPLFVNNLPDSKAISKLIERLLGILLIAYLIRFSLKQYSIRMHLYTLNRHRANILNSFKLLFSTVGKESPDVRDELILLVAAGVYNPGDTGYLTDKTMDDHILPIHQLVEKLVEKTKAKAE